jgi:hypothetical protein
MIIKIKNIRGKQWPVLEILKEMEGTTGSAVDDSRPKIYVQIDFQFLDKLCLSSLAKIIKRGGPDVKHIALQGYL